MSEDDASGVVAEVTEAGNMAENVTGPAAALTRPQSS